MFSWDNKDFKPQCLYNVFDTNLESVHLPTAHIVVNSSSKDVHGVLNHGSSVEESPTGHLRRQGQSKFNFTYLQMKILLTYFRK